MRNNKGKLLAVLLAFAMVLQFGSNAQVLYVFADDVQPEAESVTVVSEPTQDEPSEAAEEEVQSDAVSEEEPAETEMPETAPEDTVSTEPVTSGDDEQEIAVEAAVSDTDEILEVEEPMTEPARAAAVSEVNIELEAPVDNGYNDTFNNPANNLSISGGISYEVGNHWLKADGSAYGGDIGGSWQEYSVIFNEGTTYGVRVTLNGTDDNPFDENTQVTTNEGVSVRNKNYDTENNTLTVLLNVVAVGIEKTPINQVPLKVNVPAAGTRVGDASYEEAAIVELETGAPYEFRINPSDYIAFRWQQNGSYLGVGETLRAGETYQLLIGLQTTDNVHEFLDNTVFTVTGEGASLNTTSGPGSDGYRSIYTVVINVKISGAYNITTVNSKAAVDGVEVTRAEPGKTVTFTAQPPESEYPGATFSVVSWNIDGVKEDDTSASKTITMPSHAVEVIVCYKVKRDVSTDDSKATVKADLTVQNVAEDIGMFTGLVYDETETVSKGTTPADEPVASMITESEAARTEKIESITNGAKSKVVDERKTTTINKEWDDRATETKYFDKAGKESTAEASDNAVILEETSGSYGEEIEYYSYQKVEYPSEYTITYVLNGGTLDGKTGSLSFTVEPGTEITLPEPTRDGFTFDYWEGSAYKAGDKYTVNSDHTFTARWIAASEGTSNNVSDTSDSDSSSPKKSKGVKTSDAAHLMGWLILAIAADAGIVYTARRRRGY